MKILRVLLIIGIMATGFLYGCSGITAEEYDFVTSNLEAKEVLLERTQASLEQTTGELESTQALLEQTVSDLEASQASLEKAQNTIEEQESEIALLENQVEELDQELISAMDDFDELTAEFLELTDLFLEMESIIGDISGELETALPVPYTSIAGRELTWVFRLLNGDIEHWTLDVDTYRYWIERAEPEDTITLNMDPGRVVMVDFTKYVYPASFEDVIKGLYEKSEDEWEFAKEAFNIVAQLTVYSEDIGEDPRWPLETFTEGGGDCEDLAILYASLLKAAPYPYEVELVYMDSDNPDDPQEINHVIVSVAGEEWRVLSECTNDSGFSGYWESVTGFYFDL
jgi:hypothetical protein